MSIVKSFSVRDGDMFYISHNSDSFTIIDCCYEDENSRDKDFCEIKKESDKKGITRFISTHPDEDHIKGLVELDDLLNLKNFYCVRNEAVKEEVTENFKKYCELRDSKDKASYVKKGYIHHWINCCDGERGSAGIRFYWPSLNNEYYKEALELVKKGTGFNNISPIFTYSIENGAHFMWMGDMEYEFREKIKKSLLGLDVPEVDVLFAPHHGRKSGRVSKEILDKMKVKLIVIGEAPSENLDYYNGYNTITQNSAGDITFDCKGGYIHIYVENESYSYNTDFLEQLAYEDLSKGHYIGSLKV